VCRNLAAQSSDRRRGIIGAPNNDQHEILGSGFLLHLLNDIISRCASFRKVMEFQSEPTLIPGGNYLKHIFLVRLENGQ
jgi:hypothetical protein